MTTDAQPTEATTEVEPTSPTAATRLNALAAHLGAIPGLESRITGRGLLVRNPGRPGCCEETPFGRSDRITCERRSEDGGALWYFTSWGEPISPADDVVGASVRIRGYLGPVG